MWSALTDFSILLVLFQTVSLSFANDGSEFFSGFRWFDADCTICCDGFDGLVFVCAVGEVVNFFAAFFRSVG